MNIQDLERRVNLLKEENPLFRCHYADGTVATMTGHNALIAAIRGERDGVKLLQVQPEDPAQESVCGLANALLAVEEGA